MIEAIPGQQKQPSGRIRAALRRARSSLIDRRGMATVEFAMSFTAFFMLLFGIIEVGRGLWTLNALHLTTQQAVRYLTIKSSCDQTTLDSWVSQASNNGGSGLPGGATFTPKTSSGSASDCISKNDVANNKIYYYCQVTATYPFQLYIPFVSMKPQLKAQACFPVVN
jgi:Flp pilus assembly protein TadG